MNVTIDESFTVSAPRDVVWSLLGDPTKVVSCVPGAEITASDSEGKYIGTVRMKIGPVVTNFSGDIEIERMDEAAGEMVLVGAGRDAKGKGRATMRLDGSVKELGEGSTEVTTRMVLGISGRLAQFGSRLIVDISRRVFTQFVESFEALVHSAAEEARGTAEPVSALPLFFKALGGAAHRGWRKVLGPHSAQDDR